MHRIIVIDSEDNVRKMLRDRLTADGHDVTECSSGRASIDLFRRGVDAVLLSQAVPDMSALELLEELKTIDAAPPVIVISAPADEAPRALRAGAYYTIRPPVSAEEVSLLLRRALEATSALRRARSSQPPQDPAFAPQLVGETPAIRAIKQTIERLSSSPATSVLVTGESGSGKDTVARAIHVATNPAGPFVYLSPSALPESLLEAELFGVEAGASPQTEARPGLLERAEGGTLFLDEIADMPASLQSKLLRFVEDKTFRRLGAVTERVSEARVIAATHRELELSANRGALRSELLYRLAVVTIDVPPLRERRPDIPLLARHFVGLLARRLGKPPRTLTDAAMKMLVEHCWPGNVRELANVLERAALLNEASVIDAGHLALSPAKASNVEYRLPPQGIDFRELEREVVTQALRMSRGNQTRAALLLGMTRDQIRYRMAKFGMNSRDSERPGAGAI
jgi:two-component system, NtrC family, response regulator AtoC